MQQFKDIKEIRSPNSCLIYFYFEGLLQATKTEAQIVTEAS